ncbi:MAG: PilN domain-containing protein [Bacteroidota bacterium]
MIPFVERRLIGARWAQGDWHVAALHRYPKGHEVLLDEAGTDKLVARKQTRHTAACVPPMNVRHVLTVGPPIEDDTLLKEWLDVQTAQAMPTGANLDDFQARHVLFVRSTDETRVLTVLTRRSDVELLVTEFEQRKTPVSVLCTAELVALSALQGVLAEEDGLVVLAHDEVATVIHVTKGIPQRFDELDVEQDEAWPEQLALAAGQWVSEHSLQVSKTYVLGQVNDRLREGLATIQALGEVRAGREGWADGRSLEHAVALQADPWHTPVVNMLDAEAAHETRDTQDKAEATRTILGVGMACLAGMLLLFSAGILLESKTESANLELVEFSSEIAEVERAKASIRSLESAVKEAQALVESRTHVAGVLATLSDAVPADVWMDALSVEGEQQPRVIVSGVAASRASITTYLRALEAVETVRDVQVDYVNAQPLRSLYRRHPTAIEADVYQFELTLEVVL